MALSGIDLVVTDPPWGISYNPSRSPRIESTAGLHSAYNERQFSGVMRGDDRPFDPSQLLAFPRLILWGANHYASRLPDSGGWMIWDKKRGGTIAKDFIGSQAELAWGNLGNTVKIFQHLWNGLCRDSEQTEHYHPTQKPVALMRWAIELAANCTKILDPYMGSGTVLIAAKQLGKSAIGIEIEEKYCEIAAKRLSQEVFNFSG